MYEYSSVPLGSLKDWFILNDNVMGGVSEGDVSTQDDTILFKGNILDENNGGFASIRKRISPVLSGVGYAGMYLDVCCNDVSGHSMYFMVKDDKCVQSDGVNYRAKIDSFVVGGEKTRVHIPFANFKAERRGRLIPDFPTLDVTAIEEISLMIGKPIGAFSISIHQIGLYC